MNDPANKWWWLPCALSALAGVLFLATAGVVQAVWSGRAIVTVFLSIASLFFFVMAGMNLRRLRPKPGSGVADDTERRQKRPS